MVGNSCQWWPTIQMIFFNFLPNSSVTADILLGQLMCTLSDAWYMHIVLRWRMEDLFFFYFFPSLLYTVFMRHFERLIFLNQTSLSCQCVFQSLEYMLILRSGAHSTRQWSCLRCDPFGKLAQHWRLNGYSAWNKFTALCAFSKLISMKTC